MFVGIDSAYNKRFICVIFGSNENVHNLHLNLCKEFKKVNWNPPLHWKNISRESRKKLIPAVSKLLTDTQLKIWIFETNKPMGKEAKDYYLREVPNIIAYNLEPFVRSTNGVLQILADKDFEIKGERNTSDFLKCLVDMLTFRIHGSWVRSIEKKSINATIKKGDSMLKITASPVNSAEAEVIQIADITLGMYNYDKNRIKFKFVKI